MATKSSVCIYLASERDWLLELHFFNSISFPPSDATPGFRPEWATAPMHSANAMSSQYFIAVTIASSSMAKFQPPNATAALLLPQPHSASQLLHRFNRFNRHLPSLVANAAYRHPLAFLLCLVAWVPTYAPRSAPRSSVSMLPEPDTKSPSPCSVVSCVSTPSASPFLTLSLSAHAFHTLSYLIFSIQAFCLCFFQQF